MPTALDEIQFRNPNRAREEVARLTAELPQALWRMAEMLLSSVPDPDEALHFLSRFHQAHPEALLIAGNSPSALRRLITTFSYSNFLSEALVRNPEWLAQVAGDESFYRALAAEEYQERLRKFIAAQPPKAPLALSLAEFRRRKLLRILLRDVLGHAGLSEVVDEITSLADVILEAAFSTIRDELAKRYGAPRVVDAKGKPGDCGFAVIALGKLGGKELNYSSDIDLMFLYGGNGETAGPERITNKEFYKKVSNRLTELLSSHTEQGFAYRVDLRLRPDGSLGEVCTSLEGAKDYYKDRARHWELQMLIKARVAAGDRALGRELLEFVEPLIYTTTLDFGAIEAVSATRERIGEKLAARRLSRGGIDVKLSSGGIRDVEFLVQCLQRLYGGRERWVRQGGTLAALSRLHDKGLLSAQEYSRLASAYAFFRHLEHRLQSNHDRQMHTLPSDPESLDVLARKMPSGLIKGPATGEELLRETNAHLEEVKELYERVIHTQMPMYYSLAPPLAATAGDPEPQLEAAAGASSLLRFLEQRAPGLTQVLAKAKLNRGRGRFEHFLDQLLKNDALLARLNRDDELAACTIDLFEHSQYFSNQLIRNPEWLEELSRDAPHGKALPPPETLEDMNTLRRIFQRRMLAIQADSVCRCEKIFPILERTSDLADYVISAVYQIALREVIGRKPPAGSTYTPGNQMMVIALGRLGMREFDLASDADLLFVVPDSDADELPFWTAVAERMINLVTAYTGQGVIFSVDTRLRPNGREGALVQTEQSHREYFATSAEAWEGIAYMKARPVAGDLERADTFLRALQKVDWRRYGQSRFSRKQLAEMRARLEKEQGAANPLKAGKGGFYDIDFSLLYLRLKGAGIFYTVLNTPARIDVVEQMGHIEPEDAELLRQAATFYRAIDHGLRIASGVAQGTLPTSQAQLEILTELVYRWTPVELHDRPLDGKLTEIRFQTNTFFERLFKR